MTTTKPAQDFPAYTAGESETRPWGAYTVTAAGADFCEKNITVNSGHVLSLQSHKYRREHWRVLQGTLTVILDGATQTLVTGEDIFIPLGGVHCMANLGMAPCVVHERQDGLCREDDIIRYMDAYGRDVVPSEDAAVVKSIAAYKAILEKITP